MDQRYSGILTRKSIQISTCCYLFPPLYSFFRFFHRKLWWSWSFLVRLVRFPLRRIWLLLYSPAKEITHPCPIKIPYGGSPKRIKTVNRKKRRLASCIGSSDNKLKNSSDAKSRLWTKQRLINLDAIYWWRQRRRRRRRRRRREIREGPPAVLGEAEVLRYLWSCGKKRSIFYFI